MDADMDWLTIIILAWMVGVTSIASLAGYIWDASPPKIKTNCRWINEPLEGHPNKRERLATIAKIKEDERARKAHLKRIDKFIKTLHSNG